MHFGQSMESRFTSRFTSLALAWACALLEEGKFVFSKQVHIGSLLEAMVQTFCYLYERISFKMNPTVAMGDNVQSEQGEAKYWRGTYYYNTVCVPLSFKLLNAKIKNKISRW